MPRSSSYGLNPSSHIRLPIHTSSHVRPLLVHCPISEFRCRHIISSVPDIFVFCSRHSQDLFLSASELTNCSQWPINHMANGARARGTSFWPKSKLAFVDFRALSPSHPSVYHLLPYCEGVCEQFDAAVIITLLNVALFCEHGD